MTRTALKGCCLWVLFVAGSVLGGGTALAGPQDDYYQAYYLQHEKGDLSQALKLYEKVARSKKVEAAIAADAAMQARCCREDLRCRHQHLDQWQLDLQAVFPAVGGGVGGDVAAGIQHALGEFGIDGQNQGLPVTPRRWPTWSYEPRESIWSGSWSSWA